MNRPLVIFLFGCLAVNTEAQQDSLQVNSESTGVVLLSDVVVLIPSSLLIITNHELGHMTIATLFGAHNARFGLLRPNGRGGTAIGWTQWDNDLGGLGNACAALGGVFFSRTLAEGADCALRNTHSGTWLQRFFSMTYIFGRFDFPRYLLNDAAFNLFGRRGSDIAGFVNQIAGQDDGARVVTYSMLFAIAVVDLVIDWNRVALHWGILCGKSYSAESQPQSALRIHPVMVSGTLGINLSTAW